MWLSDDLPPIGVHITKILSRSRLEDGINYEA